MAKPHERVFALVGAILFLASSVGVSVFVILQMREENKIRKAATSANSSQSDTKSNLNNKEGANMLEGTKLQGFTPMASVDKLQSIDTVVGTGEEVKAGATVTAHYTGALVKDGTIFQSSHDGANQPIEFPLSGVIAGWTQGVPGMKVGGTRRLIIPAQLAYGSSSPAANIPANSDLVFDIEITAVKNQ
jgi:FKBP-type peptidyl-prolyl cis-trans isomerase